MGRVRTFIKVNGRDSWTLFDSGAVNTYVTEGVAQLLIRGKLGTPRSVPMGGKVHHITEWTMLTAIVEAYPVEVDAYVTDTIGPDEDGKDIEVLFGALAMEKWRIKLDPYGRSLDMSCYPKEFVEF